MVPELAVASALHLHSRGAAEGTLNMADLLHQGAIPKCYYQTDEEHQTSSH